MGKKFVQWFIVSAVIFAYCGMSMAYHPDVHKRIAEEAIQQNLATINGKIKDYTGLEGVDELVNNKEIKEWIKDGSLKEDLNWDILSSHFYNPITNQGLNLGNGVVGESAYDRANNQDNEWSWKMAREYFYRGLTLSTKTERDEALADSFRAIGQVMHLVQDIAVPAHTREDSHSLEPYEKYTKDNINDLTYIIEPFPYWNQSVSSEAPRQFWDSDSYDGSIPYTSGNIGLSEYTNANFASSDTIFSETLDTSYPYRFDFPRKSSSVLYEEIDSQTNKKTKYFRIEQDSENIEHFAVAGRFYALFEGWPNFQRLFISLNDKSHADYAEKLIPRAVGYSAGLLDYFFRGTLEITPSDIYVYSIIDGSITPQQFTEIKVKIRNSTPDTMIGEEIQNGILQAVAKYKTRPDYQEDLSNDPPTEVEMQGIEFSYSVSDPITIASLSSATSQEFTFDFTNNPIPVGITDLYLNVIFKGTLGNETDIAIAAGMKDLNEPQHIVFWNNTDYFLLDGEIRKAEDIENDLDVDLYGYIYPYDFTEEIGFSGTYPVINAPTVVTLQSLPPARYSRIILLVDNPDQYYLTDRITSVRDDLTYKYSFSGAVNQEMDGGVWVNTPVYNVRGIIQHKMTYFIKYYPYFVYTSNFPAPQENALGPYPATINFP